MLTITPGNLDAELRGLDELIAQLERVPMEVLDWYGKTATTRMKENHDRDAHAIQRYINRTWYLTTTIGYDVARQSGGRVRVRMWSPATYSEAVEFGTPKSAAYPFFWIEVLGVQPEAVAKLSSEYLLALGRQEVRAKA